MDGLTNGGSYFDLVKSIEISEFIRFWENLTFDVWPIDLDNEKNYDCPLDYLVDRKYDYCLPHVQKNIRKSLSYIFNLVKFVGFDFDRVWKVLDGLQLNANLAFQPYLIMAFRWCRYLLTELRFPSYY